MDESFLKYAKDYRLFHEILPTSTIHNYLNFWRFLMVKISKCHSRDLIHAIFFGQEKIPSERPCLDARHYKSFLKKKLRNFLSMESQFLFPNFDSLQLLTQATILCHSFPILKLVTSSF